MKNTHINKQCHALSQASGLSVRLFYKEEILDAHGPFLLDPDPMTLYKDLLLSKKHLASVHTSDLFEFYAQVKINDDYSIILGPTNALVMDQEKINRMLSRLQIKDPLRNDYIAKWEASPNLSVERLAWILVFLANSLSKTKLDIDDVYIDIKEETSTLLSKNLSQMDDSFVETDWIGNYHNEQIIASYIKNGKVESLRELFKSFPNIKSGTLAYDTLRHIKNMGICSTAITSRIAIDGGLNVQTAFQLSDQYIQRIEVLNDPRSIYALIETILLDFAQHTRNAKFGQIKSSHFLNRVSAYIGQHIYEPIVIESMAKDLNMSRSNLSSQFSKHADMTLSFYIMKLKVTESQHLLQFTNDSLSDIADKLSFSSQSHFQNTFKKHIGITPLQFRTNDFK